MNNPLPTDGFRRVLKDCIELAELQFQLLSIDSQEARRTMSVAAAMCGVAAAVGSSMTTVLLFALGYLIHEQSELSVGVSLLIVCGFTFVLIAMLGWFSLRLVRTAASAMAETKSEFVENLRWIKSTILERDGFGRDQQRGESFDAPPGVSSQQDRYVNRSANSVR